MGCLDDQKIMDHAYYLQTMGIQQWVRRELPADVEEVDFSASIQKRGRDDAALLVLTTPMDEAEQNLFNAMLRSIGQEPDQLSHLLILSPDLLAQKPFQSYLRSQLTQYCPEVILQFGGEPLSGEDVMIVHHPAHLLRHPEDKRQAWEVLKKAQSRLLAG